MSDRAMRLLLVLVFSVLALVLDVLWGGFVFMKLWGWFAVPAFGLTALSYPLSCGLACLCGFATAQIIPTPKVKGDEAKLEDAIHRVGLCYGHVLVYYTVCLTIGYIVHLTM